MRNLLIRFWDHFNGEFVYSIKFEDITDFFIEARERKNGGNKITFLEYKNAKDIRGFLIYEGDIVYQNDVIKKAIFAVTDKMILSSGGHYGDGRVSFDYTNKYTILGNRFEHPDLLNATPETIGYWLARKNKSNISGSGITP